MKALRLFAPADLRLLEVPRPVPGVGQVVCRIERVGVCGTDHAIFSGEASFVKSGAVRFPFTPGHEWSGVVAERGPDANRFALGDRVVGDTGVACGSCTECLLGRWPRCRSSRAVGTVNAWDGAFAEYILMPERHLYALPGGVSLENGALVEPAATALLAVRKAGVGIGDTVLVQGSGPIGLLAAKLARLSGAAQVFVTGRRDRTLAASLSFGADEAIDTRRESATVALRRLTPSGKVDRLVEATGSSAVFAESLGLVEPGGALSVVAFYDRPLDRFDIDAFVFADVAIVPVAGSLGMYPPVLELMAAGRLDASSLVTERLRLEGVPGFLVRFRDDPGRLKAMVEV